MALMPVTKNGRKPLAQAPQPKSAPKPGWSLKDRVDALAELRGLLRKAGAEEKALTQEVLEGMRRICATRFEGARATATICERQNLVVDPQLFVSAVGDRAWSAVRVMLTEARALLGEEDLKGIGEVTTTPTLRCEAKAVEASTPPPVLRVEPKVAR